MEAVDSNGKSIGKDSYVIYNGTGTIGKILELKTQDKSVWVKTDANDLWYNSIYLQAIDKIEEKKLKRKSEDIDGKIKKSHKIVGDDIDMSSELCDGGG
ncbi:MAG: DUF2098 domain-containing protein [Methanobacterium sp.]|uniref:DUF2098 domain-containing protein n=1 Tax=Methanobacterium sp. TaxID=2164 RepID=UPI003D661E44|nr:DUF2098 domain-containing protein [Methanobacterium sp.]